MASLSALLLEVRKQIRTMQGKPPELYQDGILAGCELAAIPQSLGRSGQMLG